MDKDLDGIAQIGEIINSHGVRGEVKVAPTTDDIDLFYDLPEVTIIGKTSRFSCQVTGARPFKQLLLVRFRDVEDMDAAKALMGSGIFVQESVLRPLADDECFVHDLINADVYSTDEQYLGVITDYFEAGPQGVCEVTTASGKFLFPTSKEVLKEVLPSDRVVIHLVPGLRELNHK